MMSVKASRREGDGFPPDCAGEIGPLDLLLEQKKKLEELNGWFEIALNNMVRGLSMFDADQRLIVCNESYRQMYALPEELTRPGTPLADIVRYHVKNETGRDDGDEVAKQGLWLDEHMAKLATGKSFSHVQDLSGDRTFLVTYQPLADGGWVDIQEDITEKRRAEERIEWHARHDPLTGIANRFYFRERFEMALNDMENGSAVALHWLDLDRFKDVNDRFGHPVGDALLVAVAERLRSSVRKTDLLARLGGDEFAILQTGAVRKDQCERLAKRVLKALSEPYNILGHTILLGASIGIARAPQHGKTVDDLLKNADIALYGVKAAGRKGYTLFQSNADHRVGTQQCQLETDLCSALSQNQLELHYQPIVNLRTREVTSCEALLRWRHPQHGIILPSELLPIAERSGEIIEIDSWVLEQACRDASRWPDNVTVTVNLSSLQFENKNLNRVITNALASANLEARRLELEIAESTLRGVRERMQQVLRKLRKLGVGIVLDNFGKENASLSDLRKFTFDKIKIDRTYIKDLLLKEDCAAIVAAVAALAQTLGIGTVAKGVETIDELNNVTRAGCGEVQGYYFSRPVPVGELPPVLCACQQKLGFAA